MLDTRPDPFLAEGPAAADSPPSSPSAAAAAAAPSSSSLLPPSAPAAAAASSSPPAPAAAPPTPAAAAAAEPAGCFLTRPVLADCGARVRLMGAQLLRQTSTLQPAWVSQASWWRTKCLRTTVHAAGAAGHQAGQSGRRVGDWAVGINNTFIHWQCMCGERGQQCVQGQATAAGYTVSGSMRPQEPTYQHQCGKPHTGPQLSCTPGTQPSCGAQPAGSSSSSWSTCVLLSAAGSSKAAHTER